MKLLHSNHPLVQVLVTGILILLLGTLLCPWEVFMPTMNQMLLLTLAIVLFLVWLSFFWLEQPADEREMQHRDFAARAAYITGTLALMLVVVVQTFQHRLDTWVVLVLVLMVITKSVARSISEKYY